MVVYDPDIDPDEVDPVKNGSDEKDFVHHDGEERVNGFIQHEPMQMDNVFAFGKHEDETLEYIIEIDKTYITDFCLPGIYGFDICDEAREILGMAGDF